MKKLLVIFGVVCGFLAMSLPPMALATEPSLSHRTVIFLIGLQPWFSTAELKMIEASGMVPLYHLDRLDKDAASFLKPLVLKRIQAIQRYQIDQSSEAFLESIRTSLKISEVRQELQRTVEAAVSHSSLKTRLFLLVGLWELTEVEPSLEKVLKGPTLRAAKNLAEMLAVGSDVLTKSRRTSYRYSSLKTAIEKEISDIDVAKEILLNYAADLEEFAAENSRDEKFKTENLPRVTTVLREKLHMALYYYTLFPFNLNGAVQLTADAAVTMKNWHANKYPRRLSHKQDSVFARLAIESLAYESSDMKICSDLLTMADKRMGRIRRLE